MNITGLTSAQVQQSLHTYGPNSVRQQHTSIFKMMVKWFFSPITLMLIFAATLSWWEQHLVDFWLINFLNVLNGVIHLSQEKKASDSIEKLRSKLQVQVRTHRDGTWQNVPSAELVPEDVISLSVGDLIPADAKIIQESNLTVNEASLTGESLPVHKSEDDILLTGAFVSTGSAIAKVTTTGMRTTYGKAIVLVEQAKKRSLLEKNMLMIAYFLSFVSVIAVIILTIILRLEHQSLHELLRLDLSLIIAGIPVSLPTVMTIIISIGVVKLSKKHVIVRRMAALENLSNVSLLLSDKTGTLTKNEIAVADVALYGKTTKEELLLLASLGPKEEKDPINAALLDAADSLDRSAFQILKYVPADSVRKRSTVYYKMGRKKSVVSVGAYQVVIDLCKHNQAKKKQSTEDSLRAAKKGYRVLAVAVSQTSKEEHLTLRGLIFLTDPVRSDAPETLDFLAAHGIETKLVTGDNVLIAREVAKKLSLSGTILSATDIPPTGSSVHASWWKKIAGFAEVLPENKYTLVEHAKKEFITASTGDGVNDLPALNAADVGIAVSNAVDALKGSADIVLTTPGIAVVKDALIESRKIFERLSSYSVYRISESLRLIITIAVLGITVHTYPLTPIQLILIAFLNDLPIISLAYNHVKVHQYPATHQMKSRIIHGIAYGVLGIASSLLLFFIMQYIYGLPFSLIQTAFFLKLTVSGHMLIYVAHTQERWYAFLPSRPVVVATTATQCLATIIASLGLFMEKLPLSWVIAVWVWSFVWMQITDGVKVLLKKRAH